MSIDVHVTGGGSISNGDLKIDAGTVAKCTLCAREVDASVSLMPATTACAACLRDRLDALSVARFRLPTTSGPKSIPWGKVTG